MKNLEKEKLLTICREIYEHKYTWGRGYRLIKSLLKEQRKEWNCQCESPKPDGFKRVGEHEGNYQRCLTCDRRIWS